MIFQPDLAEKVMAGEKTVTRRLCSDNQRSPWWREECAYKVGQVFTVNPGRGKRNIGKARVTNVRREFLVDISNHEAREEGFENVPDFMAAWKRINGTVEGNVRVWRVAFEVVR
jgi:hypothetical protein